MANSAWQLEPRNSRLSARERTTSTISTTSTQSSFAFVSDPEISSSFAASLESGEVSDAEEIVTPSPALSSPISSADERTSGSGHQRHSIPAASGPASPSLPVHVLSSFSSLESLHSSSGRLVTLHLEKEQSIIWPSLIVSFCCSCFIHAAYLLHSKDRFPRKPRHAIQSLCCTIPPWSINTIWTPQASYYTLLNYTTSEKTKKKLSSASCT